MAILKLALTSVLATGCGLGLGDRTSGGADNLPTLGAGPFGKLPFDLESGLNEPYVVEVTGASLTHPSVLRRADGGFRLWFGRSDAAAPDASAIWYAELPGSLKEAVDRGPELVLAPEEPWEGARVAAPAVVADGDRLVMFYEAGDPAAPAIGRADSTDGVTWTRAGMVLAGARNPTAVRVDGVWILYVTSVDPTPGIYRVELGDGDPEVIGPVLEPRPGDPDAFDRDEVTDPFALARVTEAGRLHVGLWYTGVAADGDDTATAIGYAGSFDGVAFDRFGAGLPVLHPASPNELGASAIVEPTEAFLFFHETAGGRGRIALALHP